MWQTAFMSGRRTAAPRRPTLSAYARAARSASPASGQRTAHLWDSVSECDPDLHTHNELMATIHNRMSVILPPSARDCWLDRNADPVALLGLLQPLPAAEMDAYPVSSFVNSPRNDSPECLRRVSG